MRKKEKLSVLWYSNAPWANSGYSKQSRYILTGLVSRGYRMGIAPNYGMGMGIFSLDGYTVHPQGAGLSEVETVQAYKKHHYDVLISLYDHWVLKNLSDLVKRGGVIWVCYTPLDFVVMNQQLGEILSNATYIVPFCKYGADMLRRAGFENVWGDHGIYLGVDSDIYKPMTEKYTKEQMRKWLGFEHESFVITIMKMNKGDRVKIPEMLEGI